MYLFFDLMYNFVGLDIIAKKDWQIEKLVLPVMQLKHHQLYPHLGIANLLQDHRHQIILEKLHT